MKAVTELRENLSALPASIMVPKSPAFVFFFRGRRKAVTTPMNSIKATIPRPTQNIKRKERREGICSVSFILCCFFVLDMMIISVPFSVISNQVFLHKTAWLFSSWSLACAQFLIMDQNGHVNFIPGPLNHVPVTVNTRNTTRMKTKSAWAASLFVAEYRCFMRM